MKKEKIQKIKDKVSVLLGQRVAEIYRLGDAIGCGFFPADRDEKIIQEQLKTLERIDSVYMIHVYGNFRWTYNDRVILARQDIFQPSMALLEANGLEFGAGMEVPDFDYEKYGSNRFDEIVEQNFMPIYEQTKNFIVKKIEVSKFGDLMIEFENEYRLEVLIDVSDPLNCWSFNEIRVPNNVRIGGNEIIDEDIDITQT